MAFDGFWHGSCDQLRLRWALQHGARSPITETERAAPGGAMSATLDDPKFIRHGSPVPSIGGEPALLADNEGVLPRILGDRFRLYATLGHGSLAVTYRALDLFEKRGVAVKLYAPGFGAEAGFRGQFLAAARRGTRLPPARGAPGPDRGPPR